METLTNIIEAVLFASGNAVPVALIAQKLNTTAEEVQKSLSELKEKYSGSCGIHLLTFNKKAQLATNPDYRDPVGDVLSSIKEKEFTKTILESAAIIAYKQPITRAELEEVRGVNSDYAVRTLLDLRMIEPVGRKDVPGKPILYATTDNFLKRFKISSLQELPDYDALLKQIMKLSELSDDAYLYRKDEYVPEESGADAADGPDGETPEAGYGADGADAADAAPEDGDEGE